MSDDMMDLWNAANRQPPVHFRSIDMGTHVCDCSLCRDLKVYELVHEYDWDLAEWSLTRKEWMLSDDGLAPLYMRRQATRRRHPRHRRPSLLRRFWAWMVRD